MLSSMPSTLRRPHARSLSAALRCESLASLPQCRSRACSSSSLPRPSPWISPVYAYRECPGCGYTGDRNRRTPATRVGGSRVCRPVSARLLRVQSPRSSDAVSVLAVVVAHNPGDWFEEALGSLAGQDYAHLSVAVVNTAEGELQRYWCRDRIGRRCRRPAFSGRGQAVGPQWTAVLGRRCLGLRPRPPRRLTEERAAADSAVGSPGSEALVANVSSEEHRRSGGRQRE